MSRVTPADIERVNAELGRDAAGLTRWALGLGAHAASWAAALAAPRAKCGRGCCASPW